MEKKTTLRRLQAPDQVAHYVRDRVLTPFGAAKLHREARPSDPKDEKIKKETYMEPGGSGQCACAQLLKSTIIHKHCACAQLCGLRGSRAKRDPVRALVASKFGPRGTLRSSDLCQLTLLEALIHIFSNSFFTATPSIFMGFCICHHQIFTQGALRALIRPYTLIITGPSLPLGTPR